MNKQISFQFSRTRFIPVIVLFCTLISTQTAHATGVQCYVKSGAIGANDGSSWTNAYPDLQSALGASPCTEVWVSAGTYKPTSGTDRTISFSLKNGVELYGGFAGSETQRDQRNPAANVTILSGDIGIQDSTADNSYNVVANYELDNTARLDGFTITGGHTADPGYGGGMGNSNSSPTLVNLIFRDNWASSGGGMSNSFSNPQLTNVIFDANVADPNNGSSDGSGGGMENYFSNPVLANVIFANNVVNGANYSAHGGGMYNMLSNPVLTNVTFRNNTARNGEGGGMYNSGSNPALTNVTFSGNLARGGGGMENDLDSSPTLTNVTISDNQANNPYDSGGGGMANSNNSNPVLTNVTFSGNSAAGTDDQCSSGGAMENSNSSPQVKDSIFWGDMAAFGCSAEIDHYDTNFNVQPLIISDSVVAGGCPAGATCTNILNMDPRLGPLWDNGGITQTRALATGSSAIDTGNDSTCASTDQRGLTRPQGSHCDMGAYEWVAYTLSGNVGVGGATLSYNEAGPKSVVADSDGNYTLTVYRIWSGTVVPSKPGWSFAPDHKDYSNLATEEAGQDYAATRFGYVISGNVGVAGATLLYNAGGQQTMTADSSGAYTIVVPLGWSGTITPSSEGVTFTPAKRTYTDTLVDLANQNYAATVTFTSVGAQDGWILEKRETAGVGGSMNSAASTFQLGDDALNRQYRAILSFNTAALPDLAVITSATLRIKQIGEPVGRNPFDILGKLLIDIRGGPFGVAALQLTDFKTTASANRVGSFLKTPIRRWYSAKLLTVGLKQIKTTDLTQVRLYFSMDDNNDLRKDIAMFFSGNASLTSRPQLIITYHLP